MTVDSAAARTARCRLCDAGFRRVGGIHVPSQRLGMIPATPCDRVFAAREVSVVPGRSYLAYVDGQPILKRDGDARRFASAGAALSAARRAAPRRWHP